MNNMDTYLNELLDQLIEARIELQEKLDNIEPARTELERVLSLIDQIAAIR